MYALFLLGRESNGNKNNCYHQHQQIAPPPAAVPVLSPCSLTRTRTIPILPSAAAALIPVPTPIQNYNDQYATTTSNTPLLSTPACYFTTPTNNNALTHSSSTICPCCFSKLIPQQGRITTTTTSPTTLQIPITTPQGTALYQRALQAKQPTHTIFPNYRDFQMEMNTTNCYDNVMQIERETTSTCSLVPNSPVQTPTEENLFFSLGKSSSIPPSLLEIQIQGVQPFSLSSPLSWGSSANRRDHMHTFSPLYYD